MGDVLDFAAHAAFSSTERKPKTEGETSSPRRAKTSEKTKKNSGGMRFRNFQFEMAGSVTPARLAAAELPPIASMTFSTELIIPPGYSRNVNLSSVHGLEIELIAAVQDNGRMDSRDDIARRLKDTREALELSPARICELLECAANRWSQYESLDSDRIITRDIMGRLKKECRVTSDWIYYGDPTGMDRELRLKIKAVQAKNAKLPKSA